MTIRRPEAPSSPSAARHLTLARTRRRPSGEPAPLPHHLDISGVRWLLAAITATAAAITVFGHGLRGWAVPITEADDAITRGLAHADVPGLTAAAGWAAELSSSPVTTAGGYGLLLAVLVFRRFRHLLVLIVSFELLSVVVQLLLHMSRRPRPFAVPSNFGWGGFAMPSAQVATLCAVMVGAVIALVPHGRCRRRAAAAAAVGLTLIALARVRLGVDAPTDLLIGAVLGVSLPLVAMRLFAPDEIFPVTYRRGRSAHLDVSGSRAAAIRLALRDQLGLIVTDIEPFGLTGSSGSTPMRLRCSGHPDTYLFAKLYALTHLRADRWYKLGRQLRYGRLEDERPFSGVRRLVQQEDYALRLMRDAGLPSPRPYGFAELTPGREYVLVTEFFDGAAELGDAPVDDGVIDDGLAVIRRLWDAGLAHRDIKPANLLVRAGRLLLIDVAFAEVRPSPWRQAVDLANMMLCLALRSTADRVYQRALRQFTAEEIVEAFAAARSLALPSQLRHAIRASCHDLHGEFLRLLPRRPAPVRIQRWSARRVSLLAAAALAGTMIAVGLPQLAISNARSYAVLQVSRADCRSLETLWVEAQSVPSAAQVPCIRSLPVGWTFASASAANGRSVITLDNDRAGPGALRLTLTASCASSGRSGALTRYDRFPGGCVTVSIHSSSRLAAVVAGLPRQAVRIVGYMPRMRLEHSLEQRSGGRLHLT